VLSKSVYSVEMLLNNVSCRYHSEYHYSNVDKRTKNVDLVQHLDSHKKKKCEKLGYPVEFYCIIRV
jgi:hypothetical protein